jgi:regulator of protease activity HflC (stomatin/prohibitin superfamily)
MLADFLKGLVQFAEFLWPIKPVRQFERGLYVWCGVIIRPPSWAILTGTVLEDEVLGPGLYLALPFFGDVHAVSQAWDFVESGRLDLTLKDGRTLSCEVVAKMRVTGPRAAWVEYEDYTVDRRKMLRAAVSEVLQEAEPDRFAPDRRGRLLGGSLLAGVRKGAEPMGHEVESVQVTTFVLNPRTFRLLSDVAATV